VAEHRVEVLHRAVVDPSGQRGKSGRRGQGRFRRYNAAMLIRDLYNALGLLVSAVAGALCCCQPLNPISHGPIEAINKEVVSIAVGAFLGSLLWLMAFRSPRLKKVESP
jgi:hypothetical protein